MVVLETVGGFSLKLPISHFIQLATQLSLGN